MHDGDKSLGSGLTCNQQGIKHGKFQAVEAVEGTLRFRGPRATATGQLYEQDARRTLVIDAKGDGGNRATIRLNPVR